MATSYNFAVSTADRGCLDFDVRSDSAKLVSELLQDDMDKYDVYFNDAGFHSMCMHTFSPSTSPH